MRFFGPKHYGLHIVTMVQYLSYKIITATSPDVDMGREGTTKILVLFVQMALVLGPVVLIFQMGRLR